MGRVSQETRAAWEMTRQTGPESEGRERMEQRTAQGGGKRVCGGDRVFPSGHHSELLPVTAP